MANSKLEIDVSITGLDVPLMIIVGENNRVQVFEHGKKVEGLRSIQFSAEIDSLPSVVMRRWIA